MCGLITESKENNDLFVLWLIFNDTNKNGQSWWNFQYNLQCFVSANCLPNLGIANIPFYTNKAKPNKIESLLFPGIYCKIGTRECVF